VVCPIVTRVTHCDCRCFRSEYWTTSSNHTRYLSLQVGLQHTGSCLLTCMQTSHRRFLFDRVIDQSHLGIHDLSQPQCHQASTTSPPNLVPFVGLFPSLILFPYVNPTLGYNSFLELNTNATGKVQLQP
jgi:hypothetical protein